MNYRMIRAITPCITGLFCLGYERFSERSKQKESVQRKQSDAGGIIRQAAHETSGQADAVIVDVINASRINQLLQKLAVINRNRAGANEEIVALKAEVLKLLTTNRGGVTGIHGFIGETSQVHIANIKAFINGDEPLYMLLDNNSMTDYIRGFELIQQKACRANGRLGLDAIKHHMENNPEFVERGGIYQIPKDMFAKYEQLKNLPEELAIKLRRRDYGLWKYIRAFSEENPTAVIEPMEVSYADIQAGNINSTIKRVEKETDQEFEKQRKTAQAEHAPSFAEFLKICGISAAIEGGICAGSEFVQKLKSGKRLSDFTKQDFKDIGAKLMLGSGKGAFRGGFVYIATNIYKLPASIVAGVVTAMYGICREGYLLFKKEISKKQFAMESSFIALEATASTTGAFLGKKFFRKHPTIGALAGSIIGSMGAGSVRKIVVA